MNYRLGTARKALAVLLLLLLTACRQTYDASQPLEASTAAEESTGKALSDPSSEAVPDSGPANPEPVYTLEACNAAWTMEPREITAGDYFMEWYVEEAEYHPQADEAYPMFASARFTADNITLTGTLEVWEGGMDGIAAFYPDDESLERLPCIPMIDAHTGSSGGFSTGLYGEDYALFAELGTGTWKEVAIKIDRVYIAIYAPSYARNIHTVEIVALPQPE